MNGKRFSTIGAFTASALLWISAVRADPDYNYVTGITTNVVQNGEASCSQSNPGHDYMNCVYGYVQQSFWMWYDIAAQAWATNDYCVQNLIYCTTDEFGITQTYGALYENASYIAAILYGFSC